LLFKFYLVCVFSFTVLFVSISQLIDCVNRLCKWCKLCWWGVKHYSNSEFFLWGETQVHQNPFSMDTPHSIPAGRSLLG